jgi:hypothetical protein
MLGQWPLAARTIKVLTSYPLMLHLACVTEDPLCKTIEQDGGLHGRILSMFTWTGQMPDA